MHEERVWNTIASNTNIDPSAVEDIFFFSFLFLFLFSFFCVKLGHLVLPEISLCWSFYIIQPHLTPHLLDS